MAKRISIEPRSSGTFRISATNPNPGGQCLCSPYHRGEDCVGPYLVFPRGHVVTSGRAVLPVICMGTVKAALLHVEKGGEVAQVGSGRPEDDHFDGGQPTDSTDLVALRAEYQKLAARTALLDLPSWDEFLASKDHEPEGSPTGASTRALDVNGIDPDAGDLLAGLTQSVD
jgi:hypothetical protein